MRSPASPSPANLRALRWVEEAAAKHQSEQEEEIQAILAESTLGVSEHRLMEGIRRRARITVNFHPDRLCGDGRSVALALYQDRLIRNQFESGISNGGLSAMPGGERYRWEEEMFGGAYSQASVQPGERPKYGGLDLMGSPAGACPRFGSSHLRLRPIVNESSSFLWGDSAFHHGEALGSLSSFRPVLLALLETVSREGRALSYSGLSLDSLLAFLLSEEPTSPFPRDWEAALNLYIEAQAHCQLPLGAAVEEAVLDACFQETRCGELMQRSSHRYGFPLTWIQGPHLKLEQIPRHFPGPAPLIQWQQLCVSGEMSELGERVLSDFSLAGRLDAAGLGAAARSVVLQPERWERWGSPPLLLQGLKCLWLTMVVYGQPVSSPAPPGVSPACPEAGLAPPGVC